MPIKNWTDLVEEEESKARDIKVFLSNVDAAYRNRDRTVEDRKIIGKYLKIVRNLKEARRRFHKGTATSDDYDLIDAYFYPCWDVIAEVDVEMGIQPTLMLEDDVISE